MPKITSNGLEFEVEQHGDPSAPAVLLVMGLAAQLTRWPAAFIDPLVEKGFRVVTFDNRDIGLSEKLHSKRAPSPTEVILLNTIGLASFVAPYKLTDMAQDALGLLDALDIERAHVVGASMGGMIGQILCAEYPHRISSFTALMSSTNNPALPRAQPEISKAIITARSHRRTRDELIDHTERLWKMIGTRDGGFGDGERRRRIIADVDRSTSPAGIRRQIAAIVATRDLRDWTRTIEAPSLVIHGSDDPLVPVECGYDIATTIKNSRMEIIDGMGHDLPPRYVSSVANHVVKHLLAVEEDPAANRAA